MSLEEVGKWAFLIGLIIVVIAGFVTGYVVWVALALFILGLIVGFLNVTEKNIVKFLVAVVTLLVLGIASINTLSVLGVVSGYLDAILGNFIAFVGAAGLVVAIKAILVTGKK